MYFKWSQYALIFHLKMQKKREKTLEKVEKRAEERRSCACSVGASPAAAACSSINFHSLPSNQTLTFRCS